MQADPTPEMEEMEEEIENVTELHEEDDEIVPDSQEQYAEYDSESEFKVDFYEKYGPHNLLNALPAIVVALQGFGFSQQQAAYKAVEKLLLDITKFYNLPDKTMMYIDPQTAACPFEFQFEPVPSPGKYTRLHRKLLLITDILMAVFHTILRHCERKETVKDICAYTVELSTVYGATKQQVLDSFWPLLNDIGATLLAMQEIVEGTDWPCGTSDWYRVERKVLAYDEYKFDLASADLGYLECFRAYVLRHLSDKPKIRKRNRVDEAVEPSTTRSEAVEPSTTRSEAVVRCDTNHIHTQYLFSCIELVMPLLRSVIILRQDRVLADLRPYLDHMMIFREFGMAGSPMQLKETAKSSVPVRSEFYANTPLGKELIDTTNVMVAIFRYIEVRICKITRVYAIEQPDLAEFFGLQFAIGEEKFFKFIDTLIDFVGWYNDVLRDFKEKFLDEKTIRDRAEWMMRENRILYETCLTPCETRRRTVDVIGFDFFDQYMRNTVAEVDYTTTIECMDKILAVYRMIYILITVQTKESMCALIPHLEALTTFRKKRMQGSYMELADESARHDDSPNPKYPNNAIGKSIIPQISILAIIFRFLEMRIDSGRNYVKKQWDFRPNEEHDLNEEHLMYALKRYVIFQIYTWDSIAKAYADMEGVQPFVKFWMEHTVGNEMDGIYSLPSIMSFTEFENAVNDMLRELPYCDSTQNVLKQIHAILPPLFHLLHKRDKGKLPQLVDQLEKLVIARDGQVDNSLIDVSQNNAQYGEVFGPTGSDFRKDLCVTCDHLIMIFRYMEEQLGKDESRRYCRDLPEFLQGNSGLLPALKCFVREYRLVVQEWVKVFENNDPVLAAPAWAQIEATFTNQEHDLNQFYKEDGLKEFVHTCQALASGSNGADSAISAVICP